MNNEPLLAFVDETSDRGFSSKSSVYFAMAAVVFPASYQQKVKDCIANIKVKIGIPLNVALHWRKHCQSHETRKFIAIELAKLKEITVIYIISNNKTMPIDHEMFYTIVAACTLERILKHADVLETKVNIWYGHIRRFNHNTTLDYFKKRKWHLGNYNRLINQPKWIRAESNSGIQLADMYAGILSPAILPDNYGNFETMYLEKIKHQIRKSEEGQISSFGIRVLSKDNNPKSFDWWPDGWI